VWKGRSETFGTTAELQTYGIVYAVRDCARARCSWPFSMHATQRDRAATTYAATPSAKQMIAEMRSPRSYGGEDRGELLPGAEVGADVDVDGARERERLHDDLCDIDHQKVHASCWAFTSKTCATARRKNGA
jgi:hypothetical protein